MYNWRNERKTEERDYPRLELSYNQGAIDYENVENPRRDIQE
jgi:hypothetical protein